MRINNIVRKESALLESMMAGTDKETRQYLRNMQENFVVPYTEYLNSVSRRLTEAELTPDQITQLFGTVTQGAQQAGGNETMLGRMMPDAIKKKFVDSLPSPDAGEVAGFQEKATAAVAQISDPATKQSLMQMIKTGLQNPVTQKLIISGVQGIAGIAAGALTGGLGGKLGATAAGAITGGLVGLVAAKLQGQDWKSAAKAGLKGAAVGGAGGLAGSVASGLAGTALDAASGPASQSAPAPAGGNQAAFDKEWDQASAEMGVDPNTMDPTKADPANAGKTGADFAGTRDEKGVAPYATGSKEWADDRAAGKIPDLPVDQEPAAGGITARPTGLQPLNNLDGSERAGAADANAAASGGDSTDTSSFAKQAQDQVALNQRMQAQADAGQTASPAEEPAPTIRQRVSPEDQARINQVMQDKVNAQYASQQALANAPSGLAAPIGADGNPMKEVPFEPEDTGPTAGGVPIASAEPGINRLTGKPVAEPTHWDNMTPDQQAATLAKQQQQAADAEQGTQNAKDYWANKSSNTRSLRGESIDRDLTVRMWALNESLGKSRGGVHLTEAGVGGVLGSIGSWLKTKGQNLTQTVTTDKLMQAWNKAGKPTDSDKIADLLQKQGVAPEVLDAAFKSMSIPRAAASGDRVEPTMDPAAPAQPAQPASGAAEPAEPAAPETAKTSPAAPEAPAAAPAAGGGGSSIFADPKKLTYEFESYMEAGGTIPPQMRGVLKDILLTALRTVESKQRKLNAIIKESKRLQKQVIALKKRKSL